MKKKILFLLLLLVGFVIFLAINGFVRKNQSKSGRLKIVASPTAGVFIDNVAVGKTPFEQKLDEGEYQVKLIPEGVASDTVSWEGKVKVYNKSVTYINRELGSSDVTSAGEIFSVVPMEDKPAEKGTGEIYVETEPSGAIVYLNNDEKGVSPLLIKGVVKGDHEVSVFMPGFFRRTHKVNVDSAVRTNTLFKLALDQTQKSVEEIQKAKEKAEKKKAAEASGSAEVAERKSETKTADPNATTVTILDTPTGWLRVREEPTVGAKEIKKVNPGETYEVVEETEGWYKIKVDSITQGWISSDYAEKAKASKDEPAQ